MSHRTSQDGLYVVGPATCHCGTASGTGNATYSPPTVIPHLRGTSPRSKGSIFYSSHAHAASRTLLSAISSTLVLARTGSCRSGPQPAPVPAGSCTSGRWSCCRRLPQHCEQATCASSSAADHDFDDSNTIVVLSRAWQEFFLAKSRIAPRTSRTCRCSVPVKPDFWTFDNPTSCLNTCLCLHLPSLLSRPFRPLHPWWLLLRLCRPWCKTGKTPSSSPWRPNGRRWWVMLHPSRLRVPLFCAIWTPAGCGSWVPLMTERHHGLRFSLVQRERTVALGSGAPLVMGLRPAEMDGFIYVSFETPVPLCLPPTDHHRRPNGWELTVAVPHTALALRTTAGEALVPVAIVLLLLTPVVTAVLRPHTPNVVVPEIIPLSPVILHRPAWLGDLPGTYPCHPGAVLPRRCSDHPETIVCPLAPGGCPLIAAAATLHLGHLHLDLVGDNVPILAVRAPGLLTGILKDVNTRRNNSSQASWRFPCSSTGWWPRRRTDFVSWRFPLVRGGSQETLWWPTLPFGLVSLCWSLPSYRPDKQSVGTLC